MSELSELIEDIKSYMSVCAGSYDEAGSAEILLLDALKMLYRFEESN